MCGIVGIVGDKPVSARLVDSLKRLEYRGYDSAGVATLVDGKLHRRRAAGKLANLEAELGNSPLEGTTGIGHTRWATHGAPTQTNAHPHFCNGVAVVHNGIIENFAELKAELKDFDCRFQSQTDTEVVAALIASFMGTGMEPAKAASSAFARLRGAYAIAVLFEDHPDLMIAGRNGPPLAIGHGEGEMYVGSDAIALSPFTDSITYLDDGDWAEVTRKGSTIHDASGNIVERPCVNVSSSDQAVSRGNHRHFMEKEIHEQPDVIGRSLANYVDFSAGKAKAIDQQMDFSKIDRLAITACGTAYYAGLVAKYWFERYARLPVEIDVASEFRYREMPLRATDAALVISQSGETADTLASLRYCKAQGMRIGTIVNVTQSTMARESDAVFPTFAGPEIGVASTKAFTAQLSVLASLAIAAGRQRGTLSGQEEGELVSALAGVPGHVLKALRMQDRIERLSQKLAKVHNVLYLGRGTSFPMAMEGALKLKEISYIHAEGYAAGELKHGPIALIDESIPVVVIAPHDGVFEKTVSNMQEVAARGGRIILITDEKGAAACTLETMETIVMPVMHEIACPIAYAVPIQMIAYFTAVFMGTDVDQPRNLAKSVTVE